MNNLLILKYKFIYGWHILSWLIWYIPLRTVFRFKGSKPRDEDISTRPLIVVVNHKSLWDPWFYTHTLNFKQFLMSAPMQAMATQRFNSSFLNLIYYIFIKPFIYFPYGVLTLPTPKEGIKLALEEKTKLYKDVLKHNGSIFVFPEGGLKRMPGIHEFKRGATYLQKEIGAPILLASIRFIKNDGYPGIQWWLPWTKRIVNWDNKLTYIPKEIINDDIKSAEFLKAKVEKLYNKV